LEPNWSQDPIPKNPACREFASTNHGRDFLFSMKQFETDPKVNHRDEPDEKANQQVDVAT
jgi:hypothetical protein